MNIDTQKLRNLRAARAWSQEHLASVAGLSVRTVQRIEAQGNACAESRMALAAALGLAPSELCLASTASTPSTDTPVAQAQITSSGRGWHLHLGLFLIFGSGLLLLKLSLTGSLDWALFPMLGWGLGVLLHYRLRLRRKQASRLPISAAG